jgi:hypothetical protein
MADKTHAPEKPGSADRDESEDDRARSPRQISEKIHTRSPTSKKLIPISYIAIQHRAYTNLTRFASGTIVFARSRIIKIAETGRIRRFAQSFFCCTDRGRTVAKALGNRRCVRSGCCGSIAMLHAVYPVSAWTPRHGVVETKAPALPPAWTRSAADENRGRRARPVPTAVNGIPPSAGVCFSQVHSPTTPANGDHLRGNLSKKTAASFLVHLDRHFFFRKKKFWNALIASGDRIRSPKK